MSTDINNVVFDAILKEAVALNFRAKMEAMPSEEELFRENPPSARHIRRMNAIFALERRMRVRARLFKYAKTAMYIICITATLTFAVLMTNPNVRAAVKEAIVKFWEGFTSVEYITADVFGKSAKDFSLTYIPAGYAIESIVESGESCLTIYADEDGKMLIMDAGPSGFNAVDSAHQDYYTKTVSGVTYHVFASVKSGDDTVIVWDYGGYSFQLSGLFTADELMRSAVSLD
jgi:hypothetical protein